MPSIKDDRGYNQGFKPSHSMEIRLERRCDYMIGRMNPEKNKAILELGCGTGELSYLLASKTKAHVLGVDLCKPFIAQAKKRYASSNLDYKVLDLNSQKELGALIHKAKFDYVTGNGILHHLYYSIDAALENISALLKPGGTIVFTEPNIFNPYCFLIFKFAFFRKLAKLEPSEMAFTPKFIISKLRKAGFKDILIEYKDYLLPNTPAFLVQPLIKIGAVVEKIPVLNMTAQSIYISARKS